MLMTGNLLLSALKNHTAQWCMGFWIESITLPNFLTTSQPLQGPFSELIKLLYLFIHRKHLINGSFPMSMNCNLGTLLMVGLNNFQKLICGIIKGAVLWSFGESKYLSEIGIQIWLLYCSSTAVRGAICNNLHTSYPQLVRPLNDWFILV